MSSDPVPFTGLRKAVSILGFQKIRRFSFLEMAAEPASVTLDNGQSPNNEDYITEFIV